MNSTIKTKVAKENSDLQTAVVPKIVGLTGGIGSGKSQARKFFESLGVPCWDADLIARDIHQDAKHPVLVQVKARFGDILTSEGKLDRLKMREHLLKDPAANKDLKSLLGPHVIQTLREMTVSEKAPYVVWESALIIEENIKVDRILVIDCPVETQVARVKVRNPDWSDAHIMHIISLQTSRENRLNECDDCLRNDATPEALLEAVKKQHAAYLTLWGK